MCCRRPANARWWRTRREGTGAERGAAAGSHVGDGPSFKEDRRLGQLVWWRSKPTARWTRHVYSFRLGRVQEGPDLCYYSVIYEFWTIRHLCRHACGLRGRPSAADGLFRVSDGGCIARLVMEGTYRARGRQPTRGSLSFQDPGMWNALSVRGSAYGRRSLRRSALKCAPFKRREGRCRKERRRLTVTARGDVERQGLRSVGTHLQRSGMSRREVGEEATGGCRAPRSTPMPCPAHGDGSTGRMVL